MTSYFSPEGLQHWIGQLYIAAGARPQDAEETARVLVRTSLRGIDTHGVSRVLTYLEKMQQGEINAQPHFTHEIRDNVIWFDGDGGLGQSVASTAISLAVKHAHTHPVTTLLLRRSGHLAALGQFALEAADEGMIAVICQETPPLMALMGAGKPAIGNNPIAFAAPLQGKAPLVFDMATSVVARGNVLQAIKDGQERIPDDWATGPDGAITSDPQMALQGAMLPVAGHKGIGLAMMVQVLAGSLTASATAASAAQHSATSSAGNVSAFILVINPALLIGQQSFDEHMRNWLDTYLQASGQASRYPGQRANECEQKRREFGIPVAASIVAELRKAGEITGHPFNLQPLTTD
ncbi:MULTISPECIES: Ldh family oxidoreductase [unclassified Pantoea]|uniref:Ldh family oxidoreductase n=1 Tax=unclassified Pantoea TaxID=2630326 RepID=UPI001CD3B5D5|nr:MULTISPECIES: Ldh family oxidoreductase [unclassified Pantoea]MCA1179763.1 Ldh family oxidoreductase [Pantoea sp. alder69]MCA1252358.1 Ldh family oxidoreductase [Pantoea sp. alder70]MCA1268106.1 Ldh family oxidoreductase [Pantoea sp. alder81]